MDKLFFELLQVSAGQKDCLDYGPSYQQWQELYRMAREHELTGVCYRGVERLFDYGLRAPQDLIIDWMADAEAIKSSHAQLKKRSQKLQEKLLERGIRSSILRGQGGSAFYREELQELYQTDGLDVLLDCSKERAVKFVRLTGQTHVLPAYCRLPLAVWDQVDVMLYYKLGIVRNRLKTRRLRKFFKQNRELLFAREGELTLPTVTMSVFCVLLYTMQRFLYEGMSMRQVFDYYFVLQKAEGHFEPFKNDVTIGQVLKECGMQRFAQGLMWVLQETMDLSQAYMPCEPLEQEGKFLLQEIMARQHSRLHLLLHYPVDMLWGLMG